MDFGCNIGQSCIKAVLSGARKAVGIDVMRDTLKIAGDIKGITGLNNIEYMKADFNDKRFQEKGYDCRLCGY